MKKIAGLALCLLLGTSTVGYAASAYGAYDGGLQNLVGQSNSRIVEYSDWVKVRRALLGQPDEDKERKEAERRQAELERQNAKLEEELAQERAKDKISINISNVNDSVNINDNDNTNVNDNDNVNVNDNDNTNINNNDNVNNNSNVNDNDLNNANILKNNTEVDFDANLDNSNDVDVDNSTEVSLETEFVNNVDVSAEAVAQAAAQAEANAEIDLSRLPGYKSEPDVIYGDIKADGVINLTDVSVMKQLLSGTVPFNVPLCLQAGDIDKNGFLNNTDLGYLKDFMVGKITYEQLQNM